MLLKQLYCVFITLLILVFCSCGIDEHGKRAEEEEKKQTMDSLFKDADQIPVMESEETDSLPHQE